MLSLVTLVILIYIATGLAVGALFAAVGVGKVDPAAIGSPVVFRVLILPGCVGLWPLVLTRWLGAGGAKKGGAA